MPQELRTGVLILGAGGCGLVAALAAQEGGAEVLVCEKAGQPGGTTRLSAGSIPGAGTKFQARAGIEDSPEIYYRDLIRQSGPHEMEDLAWTLASASAPFVTWLSEEIGIELDIITDFKHVGHSLPRLHATPSRTGAELVDHLLRAIQERSIPILLDSPGQDLMVDEQGEVIGALVGLPGKEARRCYARKTVLATGGFADNRALLARYTPEVQAAPYFGAPGISGEALRWGSALGAALANTGAYNAYAVNLFHSRIPLSWTTVEMGAVIVNRDGQRFGNELVGYSGFAQAIMEQGGEAFVLLDGRIRDYVAAHEPKFRQLHQGPDVFEAPDLNGLGSALGIRRKTLNATLKDYNQRAQRGIPDRFGRADFGMAPLETPLVVFHVVPGLNATQGGLRVDNGARPVDGQGRTIPNLFAGGGAAAGVSGRSGGGGYSSGNGLLGALVLGWMAGRTAAEEIEEDVNRA